MEKFLLFLGIEVLEDAGGERLRDHAEDDDLIALGQVCDHVGEIGGSPLAEEFVQAGEITGGDEALDLGLEQFAEHGEEGGGRWIVGW